MKFMTIHLVQKSIIIVYTSIEYILLTDINEPHMFKYEGIYIFFFCEVNENVNNVKVYFDVLKNLFDLFVGITI